MLKNCNYNKVKLLHLLSKIDHFLEKHAMKDADDANHPLCGEMFKELHGDIDKHVSKLKEAVAGLSKEEKLE